MHDPITLTQITIVVALALAGGLALARLKQPPILGYILTGVVLGPSGFALINNRGPVEFLAELGVLLLLFVVGMELNLRSFKKVWVTATLFSVIQILICCAITAAVCLYLNWSLGLALVMGFVGALSSTAVVVKMMESSGEIKTETGQLVIGILIAQDLAIAPMILMIRNFNGNWFSHELILKLVASITLIIVIITYLSRRQRVRIPLSRIISGEKELTALASLAFCFAAAAISGLFGLSAPYGAFLAGLILGNTHERLMLIETTKPIQSILIMFFFLSIGLLLDIQFILHDWKFVLLMLLLIVGGKTLINMFLLKSLSLDWSQAFVVGALISQLGEFAFLLSNEAADAGVITNHVEKYIISITVLSLTISPIWQSIATGFNKWLEHRNSSVIKKNKTHSTKEGNSTMNELPTSLHQPKDKTPARA